MNTFVWDNDYKNTEQVRPYLADFLAIKSDLTSAGKYPYNDSFKGKMPGLTESQREDTGIYLLQKLADLDALKERTKRFIYDGGYPLSDHLPGATERGTLVSTGFYMGGTGWSEQHHAIVRVDSGMVQFKLPRQRNWRTHHRGLESYLFMPDPT